MDFSPFRVLAYVNWQLFPTIAQPVVSLQSQYGVSAVAALQVKEEALERLTESNVAMRAEAAGAADVLAEFS